MSNLQFGILLGTNVLTLWFLYKYVNDNIIQVARLIREHHAIAKNSLEKILKK